MHKIVVILLLIFLFLNSCGILYYRIKRDELIGEKVKFRFQEKPSSDVFNLIDTNSYYVQIYYGRYYNETEKQYKTAIKFDSDGYYKWGFYPQIKTDTSKNRNNVGYGGKYKVEGSNMKLERFLPLSPTTDNYYSRNIVKATIKGDTIIVYRENNSTFISTVYKKEK